MTGLGERARGDGGGPYGNGLSFITDEEITKTNSGQWKTAVFELSNAYFSHRHVNNFDFRIADLGDGSETIHRVRVILFPDG